MHRKGTGGSEEAAKTGRDLVLRMFHCGSAARWKDITGPNESETGPGGSLLFLGLSPHPE